MSTQLLAFFIGLVIIGWFLFIGLTKRKTVSPETEPDYKKILGEHVLFYQRLTAELQEKFICRVRTFLSSVRVTGIKTFIDDTDRVLVAAAAIIPIFAFDKWNYRNVHEVLLYPGSFNRDYELDGPDRNVLGMVGNGPMQNVMLLSQQDLRNGFMNHSDTSNTGIHEFAHLIDKEDGSMDGVPETLLTHRYTLPFLKRIHEEIKKINIGDSDINPYATTNDAEFFAVASEYFFEQPEKMKERHPELFHLMEKAFSQ